MNTEGEQMTDVTDMSFSSVCVCAFVSAPSLCECAFRHLGCISSQSRTLHICLRTERSDASTTGLLAVRTEQERYERNKKLRSGLLASLRNGWASRRSALVQQVVAGSKPLRYPGRKEHPNNMFFLL